MDDQGYEHRPVFVDQTGRRRTVVRTLSACLVVGLAAFAVVIMATVLAPTGGVVVPWPAR
jgi:hypothetical protein